ALLTGHKTPGAEPRAAAVVEHAAPAERTVAAVSKTPEPKPAKEPKEVLEAVTPPEPQPQPQPTVLLPPQSERAPLSRGAAMTALSSAASSAMACKRPDGP